MSIFKINGKYIFYKIKINNFINLKKNKLEDLFKKIIVKNRYQGNYEIFFFNET